MAVTKEQVKQQYGYMSDEQAQMQADAINNYNPDGSPKTQQLQAPTIPDYNPYTGTFDAFKPGSAASQLRDNATGSAASPWVALAQKRNDLTDLTDRDKAQGQGQAEAARASDSLAMQGGITSGARERLQEQASNGIMDRLQTLGANKAGRDLDISIADARQKQSELGQVAGLESSQGQFNTNLAFQNNQGLNQYNQQKYDTQGQLYGAQQMADSQRLSGGKSWICTEVNKHRPHTPRQKQALKILGGYGLEVAPHLTMLYLKGFKRVVRAMRKQKVDFSVFAEMIDRTCRMVEDGKLEQAYWGYVLRMQEISSHYLPEFNDTANRILISEEL